MKKERKLPHPHLVVSRSLWCYFCVSTSDSLFIYLC